MVFRSKSDATTFTIATQSVSSPGMPVAQLAFNRAVPALVALLVLLSLALSVSATHADISLARIFSDHMVLQHDSTINVRGTSEPGDEMVIKFNGQTVVVTADGAGGWVAPIQTPEPGGPYEMEVSVEGGDPKVVISDIMSGEVWLCAGHNMGLPVTEALNPETEIEQAKNYPELRLMSVGQTVNATPLTDFEGAQMWECCSPESVGSFSATGYYFGRELSKKLEMPIGLIDASWAGSFCESWTPRTALDEVAEFKPMLQYRDEQPEEAETDFKRPAYLYNGMIAPLKGFPIRGVIWYQGEANVGRGHQYATLFPTLITSWRKELSNVDDDAESNEEAFPFYFVQLAPFRYDGEAVEAMPELREAQLKTHAALENTGLVVTTDIGIPAEMLPKNQQEVGRRLSLWALAGPYNDLLSEDDKTVVASGPTYESLSITEGKIRLLFKNVGEGLRARGSESLTHFMICGEDKVFKPATAVIDDDVVVVSSDEVLDPKAVRFAWDDTAEPNFFNASGLPASPFRTDDFELLSEGVEY